MSSLKIDDELAIRRLMALYCHTYDDQKPGAFCDLFTEDAELEVVPWDQLSRGRKAIYEDVGKEALVMTGQHVNTNILIDGAGDGGDKATARSDFIYVTPRRRDGRLIVRRAGRYDDVMVRTPEGWRFQSRRIFFVGK